MKFKNDGAGWRDLTISATGDDHMSVCIDTTKSKSKEATTFISVREGGDYATHHLTRRDLRKFANAILKELDRQ